MRARVEKVDVLGWNKSIETLGFDYITSGKDIAMGEQIAEKMMRYELGKARKAGLQIIQGTYCSGPAENGEHQIKD